MGTCGGPPLQELQCPVEPEGKIEGSMMVRVPLQAMLPAMGCQVTGDLIDNHDRLETVKDTPAPQGSSNKVPMSYSSLYPKARSRFTEFVEQNWNNDNVKLQLKWSPAPCSGQEPHLLASSVTADSLSRLCWEVGELSCQ